MALTEEGNVALVFIVLALIGSIAIGFAMGSPAWGIAAFCLIFMTLFIIRL